MIIPLNHTKFKVSQKPGRLPVKVVGTILASVLVMFGRGEPKRSSILKFQSHMVLCYQKFQPAIFLALLDFVSRDTAVAQASVVRKVRFLGNRCMDPGQILEVAPSPP